MVLGSLDVYCQFACWRFRCFLLRLPDGSSTGTNSNLFVVAQGALTHFVVSGFPNPTVAGVAHCVLR